jgi:hypothetical protein
MNLTEANDRIGAFIIFSNIGLFALLIMLYLLRGMTGSELTEVLKLLIPVKTLYLTAVVNYGLKNRQARRNSPTQPPSVRPFYYLMSRGIIYTHIAILYALVTIYALGGRDPDILTTGIPIVESFFGLYAGMILGDMFGKNSPANR